MYNDAPEMPGGQVVFKTTVQLQQKIFYPLIPRDGNNAD
jgi:hypothetical protein